MPDQSPSVVGHREQVLRMLATRGEPVHWRPFGHGIGDDNSLRPRFMISGIYIARGKKSWPGTQAREGTKL